LKKKKKKKKKQEWHIAMKDLKNKLLKTGSTFQPMNLRTWIACAIDLVKTGLKLIESTKNWLELY
jgi:hypothetical protein